MFSLCLYSFHRTAGRTGAGPLALRAPCRHSTLRRNPPILSFTSSSKTHPGFSSTMKQTTTSITHSAPTWEEGLNETRGEKDHSQTPHPQIPGKAGAAALHPFFPPSSSFSSCTRTGGAMILGTFWTFIPIVGSRRPLLSPVT